MKRLLSIVGIVGASCAVLAASAQAGGMRGVVPAHGRANKPVKTSGTSNLIYHNGPVMQTNTVYAIYWLPPGYSMQTSYQSIIDGFFKNVAADNGKTSNVYYSDTQYWGPSLQPISYNSTFAADIEDTTGLPPSGCHDRYTSVCLTDGQLQTEIANVIKANNLPTDGSTEYFIFTPKNVGSCYGHSCAYSSFCAYHSNFSTSTGGEVLYANMPYAAWVPQACGSGQSPNGNDADSTINVTSHEHNETITDPLGTAWYDSSGNENGDKCAWNFGTTLGGSAGAEYNQVINGTDYYLQQEWSNHSSGCVLTGI